jgi:hypothetical protein
MRRILVAIAVGCGITAAAIRALHITSIDDAVNLGFAMAGGFAVIAVLAQMAHENRERRER